MCESQVPNSVGPHPSCKSMFAAEPPRNVSDVSQALRDRVFLTKRNFKRFSKCLPQDSPFGEQQVSKRIRLKFLQNLSLGKYLNAHAFDFKNILFLKAMCCCHQICQCFKNLFHQMKTNLYHWLGSKESTCSAGGSRDSGSILGSGRSPGEGNGNPHQYSCWENSQRQRSLVGYSPWGRTESDTA